MPKLYCDRYIPWVSSEEHKYSAWNQYFAIFQASTGEVIFSPLGVLYILWRNTTVLKHITLKKHHFESILSAKIFCNLSIFGNEI